MDIDTAGWGAIAVVLVMALVTLATRLGGVLIMSLVPINDRVRRFIRAMSGSVLVALLAPIALNGDLGARMALLVAALVMLWLKKPLPAITAGIAMAALVRHL